VTDDACSFDGTMASVCLISARTSMELTMTRARGRVSTSLRNAATPSVGVMPSLKLWRNARSTAEGSRRGPSSSRSFGPSGALSNESPARAFMEKLVTSTSTRPSGSAMVTSKRAKPSAPVRGCRRTWLTRLDVRSPYTDTRS